jgi:hypothetical protein
MRLYLAEAREERYDQVSNSPLSSKFIYIYSSLPVAIIFIIFAGMP